MTLFRVTLAYDGTDFQGWQIQAPAAKARTVQGVVEAALSRLAGDTAVRVAGAGRTDAGVHALGQVASFELPREIEAPELVRALNGLLPEDVRVLEAARAQEGFHARRSAVSKLYRYVLDTGPIRLPTRRRTAGHVPWSLA
jgi:tRNA pseudouridine38-40 synthase